MKKSKIISLFLGVVFILGCDSGLDILPTGTVAEEVYWEREKDAVTAVNAVYRELDDGTMIKQLDGVTDIGYRAPSGPGTLHDVGAGNIVPSNDAITAIWNRYYQGVRKANDVIANVGKVETGDPEVLSRVEAEARFLRAYFYTQLSSLWGAVPLIEEPIDINEHVGRTPKDQVVEFVISELDNIINNNLLPLSYEGENIGRATHGAALALKARIALRNSRWAMARDASKAVMDLGIYELYPDYQGLFQYEGQNSAEIIFDRQYAPDGQTYGAFSYSASSIGGNSVVEPLHGLYELMEFKGPRNPDDPYENIDPRWNYTVYYTGQPIGNSTYNSRPDSPTPDRVQVSEAATQHGYNLKKWVDWENDRDNPSNGSINLIHIRYADVLLMYAEAKIELNEIDQSVYDAINEVRQRPSVEMPPITGGKSQDELRQILRRERGVELAFEGLRLFDMNRWGIGERKEGVAQGTYFFDEQAGEWYLYDIGFDRSFNPERDVLWPIPQSEMNSNSAITENNPGY
ncbi:RagB/SusD family nutrient uptake outer membrane protein [Fodinibius sediminis]|uniref:Starch-binding associating with outer membrane n=1 Tax=Fodinibius sediminis TaxID=1214077 RepID=A0A521C026_9BACT|nr:RagB/SusD family nutrient uptake outer membrane protein [Fodinibius sediminis]SMO52728.1 Starch-binding associating with outer membrane [Fodinibius sediminis]